ncbi:hypothetical protein [Streptoalloteichus hindustanus]|uniref:Uncharacterized protein n=1 Tax=Streptoalloteichus hindustanus TaxID=2017 RepID=A0A1M5DPQ2_STRHI|nr:hypothetical protein [Streptoalloteichus hindustanus]SHF68864.1 hypothetical protein SAMN05444320_104548 [Streptoalloteichus hindustanus]
MSSTAAAVAVRPGDLKHAVDGWLPGLGHDTLHLPRVYKGFLLPSPIQPEQGTYRAVCGMSCQDRPAATLAQGKNLPPWTCPSCQERGTAQTAPESVNPGESR